MTLFFKRVTTGYETYVFLCDYETKRQISEWHMPQSYSQKKAVVNKSKLKSMLIAFIEKGYTKYADRQFFRF